MRIAYLQARRGAITQTNEGQFKISLKIEAGYLTQTLKFAEYPTKEDLFLLCPDLGLEDMPFKKNTMGQDPNGAWNINIITEAETIKLIERIMEAPLGSILDIFLIDKTVTLFGGEEKHPIQYLDYLRHLAEEKQKEPGEHDPSNGTGEDINDRTPEIGAGATGGDIQIKDPAITVTMTAESLKKGMAKIKKQMNN